MLASVTLTHEVDRLPKSCSECYFDDICDHRVDLLTKNNGLEWRKWAKERVSKHCPMQVEEN